MFADRVAAGERLAEALAGMDLAAGSPASVVYGIPRGGVIVARAVSDRLALPLDIVVPRKLGAPANRELAIGATTLDGTTVLDPALLRRLGVSDTYLRSEVERQRSEIARRLQAYRGTPAESDPSGLRCIVVDDGLATGATAEAAVRSLQRRGAFRVALAVPVSSEQALDRVRRAAGDVVSLETPREFWAVGQWYESFEQVSDEEVVAALRGSALSG